VISVFGVGRSIWSRDPLNQEHARGRQPRPTTRRTVSTTSTTTSNTASTTRRTTSRTASATGRTSTSTATPARRPRRAKRLAERPPRPRRAARQTMLTIQSRQKHPKRRGCPTGENTQWCFLLEFIQSLCFLFLFCFSCSVMVAIRASSFLFRLPCFFLVKMGSDVTS
jgi:hypothetical protein